MLEDRLDLRLQEGALDDPVGLAARWKATRQAREAEAFEAVAAAIKAGEIKIRGVKKALVIERLETRADGCRAGTDRHRKRTVVSGE